MQYLPYLSIFLIIAGSLLILAGVLVPKSRTPNQPSPEADALLINKKTEPAPENLKKLDNVEVKEEQPTESDNLKNVKDKEEQPPESDDLKKVEVKEEQPSESDDLKKVDDKMAAKKDFSELIDDFIIAYGKAVKLVQEYSKYYDFSKSLHESDNLTKVEDKKEQPTEPDNLKKVEVKEEIPKFDDFDIKLNNLDKIDDLDSVHEKDDLEKFKDKVNQPFDPNNKSKEGIVLSEKTVLYSDNSGLIDYFAKISIFDNTFSGYKNIKRLAEGCAVIEGNGISLRSSKDFYRFNFDVIAKIAFGNNYIAIFIKSSESIKLLLFGQDAGAVPLFEKAYTAYLAEHK